MAQFHDLDVPSTLVSLRCRCWSYCSLSESKLCSQDSAGSGAHAKLYEPCDACRTHVNRSFLAVGNTSHSVTAQNHFELETISSDIHMLITEHSLPPHRLPTHKQIRLTGRQDLSEAIYRAGGTRRVAAQLNLQSSVEKSLSSKTTTIPQSRKATIEQIEAFCQDYQVPQDRMPTFLELQQAKAFHLITAIQANGGLRSLAPHSGRQICKPHRRPVCYCRCCPGCPCVCARPTPRPA